MIKRVWDRFMLYLYEQDGYVGFSVVISATMISLMAVMAIATYAPITFMWAIVATPFAIILYHFIKSQWQQ